MRRLPKGMSVLELCRVELVSRITNATARDVETYKVTNVDGSTCDVVVTHAALGKTAYCLRHKKSDDCEGTARVHCSIDFAERGIQQTMAPEPGAFTTMERL